MASSLSVQGGHAKPALVTFVGSSFAANGAAIPHSIFHTPSRGRRSRDGSPLPVSHSRSRANSLADRPLARPSADGRRGFAARSEARQTSREQDPRRKRRKKVPDKRKKKKKSRKWRGVKTSLRNIYHLPGRKNKVKFLGREKRQGSSYQSSGGVISLS